jgi:hypothetical protein
MDMDVAEIYTPRKFVKRDTIIRGNLLEGIIPRCLFMTLQNHVKIFYELASPFKGTLFQKRLHVQTTCALPKAQMIHA